MQRLFEMVVLGPDGTEHKVEREGISRSKVMDAVRQALKAGFQIKPGSCVQAD